MITRKDLTNRVYSDRDCIYFEYKIQVDKDKSITTRFSKQQYHGAFPAEWKAEILIDRTREKDTEVYNFNYVMPREGLPLELIAATGLKFFQLHIKEEVQLKSNLDFNLGNILAGM